MSSRQTSAKSYKDNTPYLYSSFSLRKLILLIGIAVQSGIPIQSYAWEYRHMAAIHKDTVCIPFEAHYESLKKVLSGNVTQSKRGMFYRDSKCRERREDYFEDSLGDVVTFVDIDDPVNHTSCTLCIEAKTIFYNEPLPPEGFSVWTYNFASGPGIGLPLVPPERPPDFKPKQISGLLCNGYLMRVSTERIVEYWYSVDLNHLILVSIQSE